jgi:choline dehydrogenase-like flavoprotein
MQKNEAKGFTPNSAPFPGPAAINSQVYDDRPGCVYHGYCNRGGCHIHAKNSTTVSTIPKAQKAGRFTVVDQAHVIRIEVDERSARVSGVTYLKGGVEYFQPADVVLASNYLDLDPVVKDPLGYPVTRITADFKDNDKKIGAYMQDRMTQWLMEADAIQVQRGPVGTMGPSTHAYGGTRMGDNKAANVVNRWGFAHEVPNLGILGASVMGTSGSHNPTLTAQALGWRTAEYLTKSWKSIAKG